MMNYWEPYEKTIGEKKKEKKKGEGFCSVWRLARA
jgi:hypothetical protein